MEFCKHIRLIVIFLYMMINIPAQDYTADWESLDQRATPEWYTNAKFGIFIHWGVYSVPSWAPTGDIHTYSKYAEWYWNRIEGEDNEINLLFKDFHRENYGPDFQYQDFAPMFTATLFKPEDWAAIIKMSGARYVVLTSKHHDGFCLWPSEQSKDWNSVDIGPERDLAGELSAAVKEAGLYMGFYYSLYEWFNPDYLEDYQNYVEHHMLPQMRDLINTYEPDIFWTDGEWEHTSDEWRSTEFLAWLFNATPIRNHVVVNDRWGNETRSVHGGIFTTEYGIAEEVEGVEHIEKPWEECRGIGGSFGYNRNEKLSDYSTSRELIHLLIDVVSDGGNLLLNIGPTVDGRIPVIMQSRLTDIGKWLEVNGEAIYGTEKWRDAPQGFDENLCFTSKGNVLYLVLKVWPIEKISIPGIQMQSDFSIHMVGDEEMKIPHDYADNTLNITLPENPPLKICKQDAFVIKISGIR